MTIKKVIGQIHLWLGLASGLVVFILGVTGCLYAFIDEVKSVVYQDRLYVEQPVDVTPKPLDELLSTAQQTLGVDHPVTGIEIAGEADHSYAFRAYEADDTDVLTYFDEVTFHRKVYIDPYTGQVLKNENTKLEFFTLVLQLHWSLWLVDRIGQNIVGAATLIFVVMLITGLVLWWPKNKAAVKQRFWFRWKDTTRWKRKNYDLHNIPGFYALLLSLVIAVTGLMWAYDWVDQGVAWLAHGGQHPKEIVPPIATNQPTADQPLEKILQHARQQEPNAERHFIALPDGARQPVRVYSEQASVGHSQRYYDRGSGVLLQTQTWEALPTGQKITASQYNVHVGAILGLPGKILAFLASLIAASLPVTGCYVWWGRKKKRTASTVDAVRKKKPKRQLINQ